jgi:hypothetical protein
MAEEWGAENKMGNPDTAVPFTEIAISTYPLTLEPFFRKQYQPTETEPLKSNVEYERPPITNVRPQSASEIICVVAKIKAVYDG